MEHGILDTVVPAGSFGDASPNRKDEIDDRMNANEKFADPHKILIDI